MNKKEFETYLNEIDIPVDDLRSNGGRIPDHAKYGTWLRRNDPIAFEVGFSIVKEPNNNNTLRR